MPHEKRRRNICTRLMHATARMLDCSTRTMPNRNAARTLGKKAIRSAKMQSLVSSISLKVTNCTAELALPLVPVQWNTHTLAGKTLIKETGMHGNWSSFLGHVSYINACNDPDAWRAFQSQTFLIASPRRSPQLSRAYRHDGRLAANERFDELPCPAPFAISLLRFPGQPLVQFVLKRRSNKILRFGFSSKTPRSLRRSATTHQTPRKRSPKDDGGSACESLPRRCRAWPSRAHPSTTEPRRVLVSTSERQSDDAAENGHRKEPSEGDEQRIFGTRDESDSECQTRLVSRPCCRPLSSAISARLLG